MIIPPAASAYAASTDVVFDILRDKKPENGGWSSLIGVVTAIIGNILISFALNTQRYAHLRLSRDKEAARQGKRHSAGRKASPSYGTAAQKNVAERRAQQNAKSEPAEYRLEQREDGGDGETQPLIPKLDSRKASSSSLDSTQRDEKDDVAPKEKSYLQSPIWWVGIGLMVVGEIGNFLAYGFAPASIVSPLGVVALISNCLIAPLLLGEKFRWRDAVGVLIAVGGCVVVVLSASDSNPKLTPNAIWDLVTRWEFETYLGVTCFLIVVLIVASNKFGEKTILIDIGLVGLFGGYTALSTKGVASLLTYSIWRVVTFPITYLLVAVLVSTAVMQIKYINRALQRFNATMVIPTQFVMFTISVIVGSAVLYRDFERQKPEDGIKFGCGCALTFFGVWCITSGRKKETDDSHEMDEDEESIDLLDEERAMSEVRNGDGGDATRQVSLATEASEGAPSIRRVHTADVGSLPKSLVKIPTLNAPEQSSPAASQDVDGQLSQIHMPPANSSAVHSESAAFLGTNTDPSKRPPLHATTSAPIAPSTPNPSGSRRPKTPLARTPTNPQTDGSPIRQQSGPAPRLLARHSAVGLFPSALTSPLSGSLSAIVADELRRGIDRSPSSINGTITRRRSAKTTAQARRPTFNGTKTDASRERSNAKKRHSIASGTEIDFETEEGPGRVRRLSAALSDMFGAGTSSSGLQRQRTLEPQTNGTQQSLEPAFQESSLRR